jgi:hypothetical protein
MLVMLAAQEVRYVKRLNLQVYQKVIIVFAALVIPMTAITIAVNMNAVSYLKDKLLESTRDKVNYYRDQLNNQITFIRNQGRLKAIQEGPYGRESPARPFICLRTWIDSPPLQSKFMLLYPFVQPARIAPIANGLLLLWDGKFGVNERKRYYVQSFL